MRSKNSVRFPELREGGLIIVCRPTFAEQFESMLNVFAVSRWRDQDRIKIIEIPNHLFRDVGYVVQKLETVVSQSPETRFSVFIHGYPKGQLRSFEDHPDKDRWEVKVCNTDAVPFNKRIPIALSEQGLHWLTDLERDLANFWMKGAVNKARIERWLSQFDYLGRHRWVGEKLLRALDLWNSERLLNALNISDEGLRGFRRICCNTARPGESGSYISNLVKRPLSRVVSTNRDGKPLEVESAHEVLTQDEDSCILFLEDCLTTGTEMQKLLKGLLNTRARDGKTDANTTPNSSCLTKKRVQFRFGVATDLGHRILEKTIKDFGMSECEISVVEKNRLALLTDSGKVALREGSFWARDVVNIDDLHTSALNNWSEHISPHAFQNAMAWGGPQEHLEAIEFCRYVGRQLFKAYIDGKAQSRGITPWPQKRIDESSLGVRNLGLTLVFQHSMPKACLPLFWAEGEVDYRKNSKRRLTWEPLFPCAV